MLNKVLWEFSTCIYTLPSIIRELVYHLGFKKEGRVELQREELEGIPAEGATYRQSR